MFRKCSIDDEPVAKKMKLTPLKREDFSSQEAYTTYLGQLKTQKTKNASLGKKFLRSQKSNLSLKEVIKKLKNENSNAAANYLEVSSIQNKR